jgi:flagellar basal-body rod protein FlgF
MDQIGVTAASGLRSRMQALDMLANNLANATTGGFKTDREFYGLFSADTDPAVEGEPSQTNLPVIQKQWTDFSQGTLQPTGSPLDVALSGKGFFTVQGPSGPLYTRNGGFQISQAGVLTTTEGYPVNTVEGIPIKTTSQTPLKIAADGVVEQDGQTLGQLAVVDFQDRSVLDKLGSNYFSNSNPKVPPAAAPDTVVQQARIEASNVVPAESAVRLVGLMRQFEMLQKAITMTNDMDKSALAEVARVGGG